MKNNITDNEKKEILEMAEEIAFAIVGDVADNKDASSVTPIAKALFRLGYRKEKEVVKQFAEKVNEVIEACERQDGYDAEGSPIYTIDTAILRVEMEQIAEQYGRVVEKC